ncbi:MAG: hemerythrin domain-containing protein [Pseudomonadota bacterium]|nr:hemerythrin domain-containing protein [Pseudomonadota bacterium]
MQLRTDHVELLDICKLLEASISGATAPSSVELFAVRKRLTAKLIAHLKAEDWLLYPRLLESEDEQVASTARSFVEEMGGLAAAFNKYVESWDAFRIEREWAAYKTETAGIIAALRCRITRENRELYPLIEKLDQAA